MDFKDAMEEFQWKRQQAYNERVPVGDQLDAMYKARQGDPTQLQQIDAKIAEIKTSIPKPAVSGA